MDNLSKWHACLMIFGWISCVTSGVLVARFAKPFWPRARIMGVAIWFMAHRVFMVIGWVSIVASLIIIYIKAKRFSVGTHALVGYVAGLLATLQIGNSFLRPAPDSKYRWIFNYAHWSLGMIAHLLALANITKSAFGKGSTFTTLIIVYLFLYISLSDLFRKLDPMVEKLSQTYKMIFIAGIFVINALGLGMIINIMTM